MNRNEFRAVLRLIRAALRAANNTQNSPIRDTIWMPGAPQTLFDFIDEQLDIIQPKVAPAANDGLIAAAAAFLDAWENDSGAEPSASATARCADALRAAIAQTDCREVV